MVALSWILAGVLAAAFLAAGSMKLARPRPALVAGGMGWAGDLSDVSVKLVGAAEVLGAIGLILPRLVRIAPVLSPVAALALTVLMLGAISVHIRRKESFVPALVLGALALVTAIVGFAVL